MHVPRFHRSSLAFRHADARQTLTNAHYTLTNSRSCRPTPDTRKSTHPAKAGPVQTFSPKTLMHRSQTLIRCSGTHTPIPRQSRPTTDSRISKRLQIRTQFRLSPPDTHETLTNAHQTLTKRSPRQPPALPAVPQRPPANAAVPHYPLSTIHCSSPPFPAVPRSSPASTCQCRSTPLSTIHYPLSTKNYPLPFPTKCLRVDK